MPPGSTSQPMVVRCTSGAGAPNAARTPPRGPRQSPRGCSSSGPRSRACVPITGSPSARAHPANDPRRAGRARRPPDTGRPKSGSANQRWWMAWCRSAASTSSAESLAGSTRFRFSAIPISAPGTAARICSAAAACPRRAPSATRRAVGQSSRPGACRPYACPDEAEDMRLVERQPRLTRSPSRPARTPRTRRTTAAASGLVQPPRSYERLRLVPVIKRRQRRDPGGQEFVDQRRRRSRGQAG